MFLIVQEVKSVLINTDKRVMSWRMKYYWGESGDYFDTQIHRYMDTPIHRYMDT